MKLNNLLTFVGLAVVLTTTACRKNSKTVDLSAQQGRVRIGMIHPPIPMNFKAGLSSIVNHEMKPENWYSFEYLVGPKGPQLWLSRFLSYQADSKTPRWQLRVVLNIKPLASDETLVFGSCKLAGKIEDRIIAVALYQNAEYLTNIRRAWRINLELERFEEVNPSMVVCYNEGWGA